MINIFKKQFKINLTALFFFASTTAGLWYWLGQGEIRDVSAGWWNDSWSYRKAITVTNNGAAETDVYLSLTLDTDTASTSMQADCGDFRFISGEGKELPYYIESGCRTTANIIYVNLPTFPTGEQTIYFYYGNPSATNGFAAAHTGAVTQANMKMSLVNGTAFVDFSSAGTLTDYPGSKLVISDSAGKNLTGFIKAAGTGETYGDELLNNTTFDTDTSGWFNFQSTIASIAGGYRDNALRVTGDGINTGGYGWPNPYTSLSSGKLVVGKVYVKNGTATWPMFHIVESNDDYTNYGTSDGSASVWTQRTIYVSQPDGETSIIFEIGVYTSPPTTNYVYYDDASLKQVLTPSVTGVTIASTSNGSTYNWAAEDSGFNRNDTSGYTYTIYPLKFSTEASDYSIGYVGAAETGPGPVGYWSFDEGYGTTAHDESANGNDGTITGATWQDESMCVSGKCLYFNGNDDYIDCGTFDPSENDITIQAWVKWLGDDNSHQQIVVKTDTWEKTICDGHFCVRILPIL